MGLFTDLFSTKPAEDAAAAKKAGLQQGYDALSGLYQTSRDALAGNLESGRDALTTNIGAGNNALTTGYGSARDAITSGYGDASALYSPLVASTTAGAGAYGDATGANGQAGLDRAKALFTATPGYQSGFDLLTNANDRLAASRGILASGNTIADTAKLATTYADQNYGNFVNRLAPYLGANQSAISGAAGLDVGRGTALAGAYGSEASGLSNNFGTLGTGLNASYGTEGAGLSSIYQGQGQAANANLTGQGQAQADADLAAYSASGNFWNTLLGAANLGLKATGVGGFGAKAK